MNFRSKITKYLKKKNAHKILEKKNSLNCFYTEKEERKECFKLINNRVGRIIFWVFVCEKK